MYLSLFQRWVAIKQATWSSLRLGLCIRHDGRGECASFFP